MLEKIKNNITIILIAALVLYFIGRYFYKKPKYINGESAPDFTAKMLSSQDFKLSQLKGKYVLLDFWGSWCGPCLDEAPNLKQIYSKYHGQAFKDAEGFEIVAVGIESKIDNWQKAIDRLGLTWAYHVSDFQNLDSPIAKLYGVRVIPTKFLLNTEGVIMAVNPTMEEVEKILDERLKN